MASGSFDAPCDIHHTVPHLKGLNSGLEPLTSHGRGSNSMGPMLALKRVILHHREANEWFAMLSIVPDVILPTLYTIRYIHTSENTELFHWGKVS